MAEMFLWAAAGGLALFSFQKAKKLGLLDPVPLDPKARVASYSSAVMAVLKDQLPGSQVEAWTPERVEYCKAGQRGALWTAEGAVHCRWGDQQESFPIGDRGYLVFLFEGAQMSVQIFAAESDGAEHSAQVSVRMLHKSA